MFERLESDCVVLWGCGQYVRSFFGDFEYYRSALLSNIAFFIDDDTSKIGKFFYGKNRIN